MKKKFWVTILMGSMIVSGVRAEGTTAVAPDGKATNSAAISKDSNQTVRKEFSIKGDGTLQLAIPNTWQSSRREITQAGRPVTVIELNPDSQQDFAVMLEVAAVGEDKTKDLDVKKFLQKAGQMILPKSVEKSLDIQDLKGQELEGAYFTVTDKRYRAGMPQPGEYKYLTQGYAKLSGLVITFRVVSNRAAGAGKAEALEMIRTAHLEKSKPVEQK
jgi:hypothetical protein